jgi:hypothetical protein
MSLVGYPDPIAPQVDINDYLNVMTTQVGTDTVTWAAGTATPPSKATSRFPLAKVGVLSRLYLDIDAGSATGYDFTAGGGTGAAAADGMGPWGIMDRVSIRVNGGQTWYDVSGFGTFLANAIEDADAFPQDAPGTVFNTAPRAIASRVFDYPVAADGRPRFGLEIPLALRPDNPLGMILLQNEQTSVEVVITWATLDHYALLAGGASATLTLTVAVTAEYFDVPPRDAFVTHFLPLMRWASWWSEGRQDVVSIGAGNNALALDNHDTYLRVIALPMVNNVLNVDAVDAVRLVLNRQQTKYDHTFRTQLRRQRRENGKDLPAVIMNLFASGDLRSAIHADAFTDVRLFVDIASGTALGAAGTNFFRVITHKLVDLGAPGSAV